jgi:ribosomal-protein-alanine N-acetyltransferase
MTGTAALTMVRATIASARRIAAIQAASFPEPWGERFVASLLQLPGTVAFVGQAEGADLGYVLARAIAGEAEVLSIAVAASARHRGVGRALLAQAMAAASAAGSRDMHLEVSVANGAARALYESLGFTVSGRRPRYYADGADALILRRTLPSGEAAAGSAE